MTKTISVHHKQKTDTSTNWASSQVILMSGEIGYASDSHVMKVGDGTNVWNDLSPIGGEESSLYHPDLFDHKWTDHTLNNVSWLRADTFSWQDGGVYEAAYQHLVDDLPAGPMTITVSNTDVYKRYADGDVSGARHPYCWQKISGTSKLYTNSETPSVGDITYGTATTLLEEYFIDSIGSALPNPETETIAEITISYYRADDGHKIVLADQESNVAAIYNATGVAWYYILDTTNTQFKLPRTKFGITGLRDTVGNYVAPGLPNIAGPSAHAWTENSNYGCSAPFYKAAASGTGVGSSGTSSTYRQFFDASRSSSIYGNSTTVQPPATQMYLYFYVGNFTQTALENTAGLNAELFNGKVDVGHQVISFQVPTSSNGYKWYRKYADGWVEQGGTFASAGVQVTLPIPMADTNYTLVAGYTDSSSTNYPQWTFMGIARTTTSITPQASGLAQSWMVCGMAA